MLYLKHTAPHKLAAALLDVPGGVYSMPWRHERVLEGWMMMAWGGWQRLENGV